MTNLDGEQVAVLEAGGSAGQAERRDMWTPHPGHGLASLRAHRHAL